jgi:hypothetical protein
MQATTPAGDIEFDSGNGSDSDRRDLCRAFTAGLLASHSYDRERSKLTAARIFGADHHRPPPELHAN